MDPKSREAYNSWGQRSSSRDGQFDDFNVDIFFEILSGSQVVEPYIGQLAVASFVSRLMKLAQAVSSESSSLEPVDTAKLFNDSAIQTWQRPVQVAQHLRGRIQRFVVRKMSQNEFQDYCDEEAILIFGTGFGVKFLFLIGETMVQESNIFLQQTWYGFSLMMYSSTAKKMRKIQRNSSGLRMLSNLVVSLVEHVSEDESDSTEENKKLNMSGKDIEEYLPHILDLAWAFNARDISQLIEVACQKLFTDAGAESSVRVRRAKALSILGQLFLDRDEQGKRSPEDPSCKDPEMEKQDIKERVQVAFQTALQSSAPSSDDSEEMIQRAKSSFQG